MARHLRVEFPGAIYHVTCRMIGDRRLDQSRLFVDDKDQERFVDCLSDRVEQYRKIRENKGRVSTFDKYPTERR